MTIERALIGTADGGVSTDPNFENVTLLLHGDGTNGAQNNTFLDSSTNNFAITRNGNTTQGSFSPYGDLWSNYFDGSGDYLSVADNAAFTMGSGNFTIEGWVYFNNTSNFQCIVGQADSVGNASTRSFRMCINALSSGKFEFTATSSSTNYTATSSQDVIPNTWYHWVFVRNGNTGVQYINGSADGTVDLTGVTINDSSQVVGIGAQGSGFPNFNGYISNLRIVKGTALYTSNFTPSTTPLTAISGTSLLTCQSNRFVDNSANNFTISATGNPSAQPLSPFLPTAPYSTAVNGGSGYFDSNGDYLSAGPNAAFSFGTGDFTVEGWVNSADVSNANQRGWLQTSGSAGGLRPNFTTGVVIYFGDPLPGSVTCNVGGTSYGSAAGTVSANTWAHIAVTRNSGTVNVWVNGVSVASGSGNTSNLGGFNLAIGGYYSTSYLLNGYVSSVRIVKGTAVYTSNFTPPTAPLAAITNTSLLCNFTNAGIYDNAMKNDLETVGNAQISTSVKKYGTGSLVFDGAGDWLVAPSSVNLTPGTGDFTFEAWVYPTSYSNTYHVLFSSSGTGGLFITTENTNFIVRAYNVSTQLTYSSRPTLNTWTHVAISRASGTLRLFYDGVLVASASSSYNYTQNSQYIGGEPAVNSWNGYIDDLRITIGVARYTANFTPPTAAFPNQ